VLKQLLLTKNGFLQCHYNAARRFLQWGLKPTLAVAVLPVLSATAYGQSNRWSVTTLQEWELKRPALVSNMQVVMGPLPAASRRVPLELKVKEEVDTGAFLRRRIEFTSEPGSRLQAYLLVPKGGLAGPPGAGFPAVLALHQTHQLGPKVVVGLGDTGNDGYGVELATRGYVVIAPPYPLLGEYEPNLKKLGYVSGTMKAIWDNIRALDVLQSLPFVRTNRFGAIGHSLGGHNALYTAVFDGRIKVIATSCGFDSFRDYMNGNIRGWTSTRYMPRLLDYPLDKVPFDFYEVLALPAPRQVFVNAPMGDTNFKWRSVDAVAREVWPVYRFYKAEENLQIVHPDCGHSFPPEIREQAYRVLDKVLR
jgi:hypothetical protein